MLRSHLQGSLDVHTNLEVTSRGPGARGSSARASHRNASGPFGAPGGWRRRRRKLGSSARVALGARYSEPHYQPCFWRFSALGVVSTGFLKGPTSSAAAGVHLSPVAGCVTAATPSVIRSSLCLSYRHERPTHMPSDPEQDALEWTATICHTESVHSATTSQLLPGTVSENFKRLAICSCV